MQSYQLKGVVSWLKTYEIYYIKFSHNLPENEQGLKGRIENHHSGVERIHGCNFREYKI